MAKKAAPKAAEPKAASAGSEKKAKSRTKAEIYAKLAESSGLSKKQISTVFDHLSELIKNELGKKGPGLFVVPGLLKIKVVRKPATKAQRKMNPFTKQMHELPGQAGPQRGQGPAAQVAQGDGLTPIRGVRPTQAGRSDRPAVVLIHPPHRTDQARASRPA